MTDLELDSQARPALARIGAALRASGLTSRALAAWAGTGRLAALPARLAAMALSPITPASAGLALFVGGAAVARDQLRVLTASQPRPALDDLLAHQLIEDDGRCLRARVAILPLGQALLVCDRLDAPIERDLVCWPDDSSHHLATAIPPGRRADWLDLGCGSAFAPLARPDLAMRIAGIDINERAVHYARLGAALSGIAHFSATAADVAAAGEAADLVTCNAPIPDPPGAERFPHATIAEVWRRAEPGFFERMWPAVRRAVRPGGATVVHGATDTLLPALADAAGERVIVIYTPDAVRGFAVAWWRPDAPDRFAVARRTLTPDRPHIDPRDRADALEH